MIFLWFLFGTCYNFVRSDLRSPNDGFDINFSKQRSIRSFTRKVAYIGGLLTDPKETLPIIKQAIKDINTNTNILSNYQLHFVFTDLNGCSETTGLTKIFDLIEILPKKLLLINGINCSKLLNEIDESPSLRYSPTFQIITSNTDPASIKIKEDDEKNSLFRLVPTELAFNQPRTILIKEILKNGNEKKIGLVYQNVERYLKSHIDQVNQILEEINIGTIESEGFDENFTETELKALLLRLRNKNVELIIGNFNETWANRIACIAHQEKMYDGKYIWILSGDYTDNWWKNVERNPSWTKCFNYEIERVIDGLIRIDILPYLEKKIPEHKNFYQHPIRYSKYDGYTHDSIWTIALALHNISQFYAKLENEPVNESIDYLTNSSLTYQNPKWEEALRQSLSSTSFQGVTGHVSFNQIQGRAGYSLIIKQFQAQGSGYNEVNVGMYESLTKHIDFQRFQYRLIEKRRSISTLAKKEFDVFSLSNEVSESEIYPFATTSTAPSIISSCSCTRHSFLLHIVLILVYFH